MGQVRRGRRTSHNNVAATPTKIATTMCDMIAAAMSTAGSHGRLPVSSVYASAPSANKAKRERDLERVLARERARDVAAVDVPARALLHEHPERGDRERGRRRPRRLHALGEAVGGGGEHERPAHRHELERDVVVDHRSRNATITSGTGSSTPDREAGVPVGRPPREADLPNQCARGTTASTRGRPCRRRWWSCSGKIQPNWRCVRARSCDPESRIEIDDERADRDDRPTRSPAARRAALIVPILVDAQSSSSRSATESRSSASRVRRRDHRRRSTASGSSRGDALVDHGVGHGSTACQAERAN